MDLGAERAGARIIFANDIDPDAVATLGHHFPDTEVVPGDVAEINSFPHADLVIGGYPCQSFSMGGRRNPAKDSRTQLYLHFARCLQLVEPKYFVAENVSGLQKIQKGNFLQEQVEAFERAGKNGYRITAKVVDAKEYGVPQTRKRLILVGVRRDLEQVFVFPSPMYGKPDKKHPELAQFASHGDALAGLPLWPAGEFYERPHDPPGNFSWYFMSRNRKARWDGPSYTVVANWRHTPLHPACPTMRLVWSDLANGWKQGWEFTDEYEHTVGHPDRAVLDKPRRMSWREIARVQTFPPEFEPVGNVESRYNQIGNAVPPELARTIISRLIGGDGLAPSKFTVAESGQKGW